MISGLNRPAFDLAVYASPWRLPATAQDSLPAAGPALPDGIGYPQDPDERFHVCGDPPLPSFLAQCQFIAITDAETVGDLLQRHAPERREHRPLGVLLALRQRRFFGLDRLQLGVGFGKPERPQRLGMRLALHPVEQRRVLRLERLDALLDPRGEPGLPVLFF